MDTAIYILKNDTLMFNKDNSAQPHAGVTKRPKVIDSRSILAGVRGFKSLPPHPDFNIDNPAVDLSGINTKEFEKFLKVRKGLSDSTVRLYLVLFRQFVNNIRNNPVTGQDIEDYLSLLKNKRNDLAMLKACFRDFLKVDIVGEFKIPRNNIKPKILPDINKISRFYGTVS